MERESLGSHEVDVIVFGKIKADELAKKEAKAKAAVIAEQENSIEAKSESNTKPEPATKPETNPVGKKDD